MEFELPIHLRANLRLFPYECEISWVLSDSLQSLSTVVLKDLFSLWINTSNCTHLWVVFLLNKTNKFQAKNFAWKFALFRHVLWTKWAIFEFLIFLDFLKFFWFFRQILHFHFHWPFPKFVRLEWLITCHWQRNSASYKAPFHFQLKHS